MRVRMMRQVLMQAITNERADGDVDFNLTHQLAVVHDAGEQTGEHQPYRYLGIDAGPTIIKPITIGDFLSATTGRARRRRVPARGHPE